ncbi:hypothetical protein LMG33810_000211 [Carnimonas sp. LMG 33810]
MLISIVIPTFKRTDSLARAVDSALAQTYPCLEVIVVDDNTESAYSEFAAQMVRERDDNRLRLFKRPSNGGGGKARNSGILRAKGEYIAFLDDDDFFVEDKIRQQVAALASTGADVCSCNMVERTTRDSAVSEVVKEALIKGDFGDTEHFVMRSSIYSSMLLVRRAALIAVRGFSPVPRYQEKILLLKLFLKDCTFTTVPKALVVLTVHGEQRVSNSDYRFIGKLTRCYFDEKIADKVRGSAGSNIRLRSRCIRSRIACAQGHYVDSVLQSGRALASARNAWQLKIAFKAFKRNVLARRSGV